MQSESPAPLTTHPLVQRTFARHVARFGVPPRWGAVAPGRVNLIGEHTDYNEGFVLPVAIDRATAVVASAAHRPDNTSIAEPAKSVICCCDLAREYVLDLHAAAPPSNELSASYLLGVAAELAARTGAPVAPLNVTIASTVPIGAGLASSAALCVAWARVLLCAAGDAPSTPTADVELAAICQHAERRYAGANVGIMDPLVSIAGRAGHALLIDCRSHAMRHIPFPSPRGSALLVMPSGVAHQLARSAYGDRRAACERAARALCVPALRDANGEMLAACALDDDARSKAQHVIDENARTVQAAAALHAGNLHACGELMSQSHCSLRDRFDVSCHELNVLVDAANELRGRGVFGARMTGGGFGGCAIALCRPDALPFVQHRIRSTFKAACARECAMFVTGAVDGAWSQSLAQ